MPGQSSGAAHLLYVTTHRALYVSPITHGFPKPPAHFGLSLGELERGGRHLLTAPQRGSSHNHPLYMLSLAHPGRPAHSTSLPCTLTPPTPYLAHSSAHTQPLKLVLHTHSCIPYSITTPFSHPAHPSSKQPTSASPRRGVHPSLPTSQRTQLQVATRLQSWPLQSG